MGACFSALQSLSFFICIVRRRRIHSQGWMRRALKVWEPVFTSRNPDSAWVGDRVSCPPSPRLPLPGGQVRVSPSGLRFGSFWWARPSRFPCAQFISDSRSSKWPPDLAIPIPQGTGFLKVAFATPSGPVYNIFSPPAIFTKLNVLIELDQHWRVSQTSLIQLNDLIRFFLLFFTELFSPESVIFYESWQQNFDLLIILLFPC